MAIAAAVGVEPIPGYRLVDRLGFGGYGEVWKVTAPGGLTKAMKIVYGDLSGPRAEQELKSLERVKAVRHPFILSLERFEIVERQLLIITELADGSLLDRFKTCREGGLVGIPRAELLAHLRDAAEALDYMNDVHGLQHLDVKPENLLLVAGRVKVADFGLVKEFAGGSASITGGVTPVYAPAEAFDGRVSRYSDQYSLAIVYQEMLTGARPFPGTTAFQLAAQHSSAAPLLDALPTGDRPAVGRALAKVPEHRFASCRGLVEALTTSVAAEAPPPRVSSITPLNVPTLLSGVLTAGQGLRPTSPGGDPAGLRPTVIVGLGGLAGAVLRRLRRRLHAAFGDRFALFQLLQIDTNREALRLADGGEPLAVDEIICCPLRSSEDYRGDAAGLLRWLDRRWLYNIPRSRRTEGLRPLGRLALVDNLPAVLAGLAHALSQASSPEARAAAVARTGHGPRGGRPRVFLVAALSGGTGGGMLVDVAYAVHQALADARLGGDVTGLLALTGGGPADQQARARVNAYAALTELDHWSRPEVAYPGAPEQGLRAAAAGQPPLTDCYVFRPTADSADLADLLAEYLFFDAGGAGAALDQLRADSAEPRGRMTVRGCGLAGLGFPRQPLTRAVARALCRRLIEGWQGDMTPAARQRLIAQTGELIRRHGLTEEAVQDRLHDRLAVLLGDDLAGRFQALGDRLRGADAAAPGGAAAVGLVSETDRLLGKGDEGDAPAPVEAALGGEARRLAAELREAVAAWLMARVEAPGERLRAAETAQAELTGHLGEVVERGRERVAQLRLTRHSLRSRLLGQAGKATSLIHLGLRRLRLEGAAEQGLFRHFCLRTEELIEQAGLDALCAVQALVAALSQDLARARQRLGEVLAAVPPAGAGEPGEPANPAVMPLYPHGAEGLLEAATAVLGGLPAELSRRLEALFQAEVLDATGGLWGLLGGQGSADEVPRALLKPAGELVGAALREVSVLDLLARRYGEEGVSAAVRALVQAAEPLGGGTAAWQRLVLALPEAPSEAALREQVLAPLAGTAVRVVECGEQLVVARETAGLALADLAADLATGDAGIVELARQLTTRCDVRLTEW